jgi:CMP/dCMP kinase
MRKVITVDGLAGSGKSTLACLLADKLGFIHFNSGLLYRAAAFLALDAGVDPHNGPKVAELLDAHDVQLQADRKKGTQLLIDGVNRTDEVQSVEVSNATSCAATCKEVRQRLVKTQREIFPGLNIVAEGRDMGTVIFPESSVKFYVTADLEVRIQRRLSKLYGDVQKITPTELKLLKQKVEKELLERDARDSGRDIAPLKPAPDAVMIDNSAASLTEIVQSMYDTALRRGLC